MDGHPDIGAVKRAFGCAPFMISPFASLMPGRQGLPSQSMPSSGTGGSPSSHQTVPSIFRRTLVNMVFFRIVTIALRLDLEFVPGATPKNPDSGFIAHNAPSLSIRIH